MGGQTVGFVFFTSVPATRVIHFERQTVGMVFTSVPALICCRHQTVGVVFPSVPAIRLIRGGRQTVEVVFHSVPGSHIEVCW